MCVAVGGDKDPVYGSTCQMIGKAALCLVKEAPEVRGDGAALGRRLLDRLTANACMTFVVEG